MLTVPQAAARLGVAETTLRIHCRQGRVPGAQFIGGIWLLPDPPEVDRPKMGRPADKSPVVRLAPEQKKGAGDD